MDSSAPKVNTAVSAGTPAALEPLAAGLSDSARELMRLAVAALARREHSRGELERKLSRRRAPARVGRAKAVPAASPAAAPHASVQDPGADPYADPGAEPGAEPYEDHEQASAQRVADIAQVLDRLQARAYLSDTRMAQALVRTRAPRYGRLRIAQELERRGVDRETIAASLPDPRAESAAALALWRRKFGKLPANAQERARQGRYLASRGFAPGVVARILGGAADGEPFPES